jgi:hypothetical protein
MTSFSSKANRLGVMAIKWMISSVAFVSVTSQISYGLSLTVVTTSGPVRGQGVEVTYKGIPYAAPPVGQLRWARRRSHLPDPILETRLNLDRNVMSANPTNGPDERGLPQLERLDSGRSVTDRLPVMVWISRFRIAAVVRR